jgi:hypothetical protein
MNERRARRTVTRREAGGRRPLTTAAFTPITGEPFPIFAAVSLYPESGMGHPDAVGPPPAVSPFDYRVRVHEYGMAPRVMKLNVANLYDYVTGAGIHRHG